MLRPWMERLGHELGSRTGEQVALVIFAEFLCSLLLPPLVIGLLLVFMVGPYTTFGALIAHFNWSATNTFLALVIAEVYESAPYYIVGAQAAIAHPDRVSRLVTIGGVGTNLFSPAPGEGIRLLTQFTDDPTREHLIAWLRSGLPSCSR